MLKLAASTKVLFIKAELTDEGYGYMGWNGIGNLACVLNARLKQAERGLTNTQRHHRVHELINLLATQGYLTGEQAMDGQGFGASHWVVEKAIPFDIREAVKHDEIPMEELIKQLKV